MADSLTLTAAQRERERLRRADAEALYRAVAATREAGVALIESALTTAFIAGLNAATLARPHVPLRKRRRSKGKL